MPTVRVGYTIRTQLNYSQRSCKAAKNAGGYYMAPQLDMEIRPPSVLDHQVAVLQAHEFDFVVEQKQREKQKEVETCSLLTFRVTFCVTRKSIASVTSCRGKREALPSVRASTKYDLSVQAVAISHDYTV